MTKAVPTCSPPTRRTFALVGAVLVAGGVPVTEAAAQEALQPDAELLRLCAEYHRLDAQMDALHGADDDLWRLLADRRNTVQDALEGAMPATPEGVRAKARVAIALLEEATEGRRVDDFVRFAWSVLEVVAA
jgi:hypothetical protein